MVEPLYCSRKLPSRNSVSASLKEMPIGKNDQNEKDMEIECFKIGSRALWAFELKKDDLSHIEEIV